MKSLMAACGWARGVTVIVALSLGVTALVARATDGTRESFLAGFGSIPFGSKYGAMLDKFGGEMSPATCFDNGQEVHCLEYELSFRVGSDEIRAYVRHSFPNNRAGMAFVDFTMKKRPDRTFAPLEDCDLVGASVVRQLMELYGAPDHPVTEELLDDDQSSYGVARTTSFTFKRGGRIDYEQSVLLGSAQCLVRVHYWPPES